MKAIGKFILFVLDGIAKVLAFLLISLGLWLPTLFTVGFFIVCGATHTRLSGSIMAFYWCGLGFTAICGFAVSMYMRMRKKRKLAERNESAAEIAVMPEKKKAKKSKTANPAAANPIPNGGYYGQNPQQGAYAPYNTQGYAPYPPPPVPPQNYQPDLYGGQGYSNMYAQSGNYNNQAPNYNNQVPPQNTARADNSDLEKKYFSPDKPARYERTASFESDRNTYTPYGKTMTKTQAREADDRLNSDELWRRLSGTDVPDEQPLVFRTRKDPDLYVYEYSDRLQYWRRKKTGMVLEQTEFKKKVDI